MFGKTTGKFYISELIWIASAWSHVCSDKFKTRKYTLTEPYKGGDFMNYRVIDNHLKNVKTPIKSLKMMQDHPDRFRMGNFCSTISRWIKNDKEHDRIRWQ